MPERCSECCSDTGTCRTSSPSWESRNLSEEDRLAVSRARRIQRFLTQPFTVAEAFTGMTGKYVPARETVRGFKEILEGQYDHLPEQAFYMVGTIDEAIEKAEGMGVRVEA